MDSKVLDDMATPRGKYPHVKRAGNLIFVSGISSRRPDNSFEGASVDAMGVATLDIRAQTRAVIEIIQRILVSAGAGLDDLMQVTCYLVSMNDFKGYNEVYGTFFSYGGPTRTTVAAHQLPHPHILIEICGVAYKPSEALS